MAMLWLAAAALPDGSNHQEAMTMTNLDDFLSDTPMLQQQQQQAQEASKTQQDAKSPTASEQTKEVAQGETASPKNPASWKGLPLLRAVGYGSIMHD